MKCYQVRGYDQHGQRVTRTVYASTTKHARYVAHDEGLRRVKVLGRDRRKI